MEEPLLVSLVTLPLDVLLPILSYLDLSSFLSLCRTCKAFQTPEIRFDSGYWRRITCTTFPGPNQPLIQGDGRRWHTLFQRMLAQSHAFSWGNNNNGCLGHKTRFPSSCHVPQPYTRNSERSWPDRIEHTGKLGSIADVQCGDSSTILLTSKGVLYSVGRLSPLKYGAGGSIEPRSLSFPFTSLTSAPSALSIREFSVHGCHVLGRADNGRIWYWTDMNFPAEHIQFTNIKIEEFGDSSADAETNFSLRGRIRQVVAGKNVQSAYVTNVGIVLWQTAERGTSGTVSQHIVVPKTSHQRQNGNDSLEASDEGRSLGRDVGEVVNYIVLEHFIVFVTDIGSFFAARFLDASDFSVEDIVELRELRHDTHCKTPHAYARNCAVWVEQDETGWDESLDLRVCDEEGLSAYHALTIAAGAEHCAALVLVNESAREVEA
ncbi:uncharacterized protein K452DRAFT_339842 [Aplosporella prunicola CBS 121167]|uniref:F-box domain-containing protein n=1 Tax=Aplosporella prunicola CBS 121167 TaxID=1176127 RepID=A0A6A6B0N1_9PEZI|nr:uncharacterized protein K452DRAFT_339842 [Aplosporella prunicola CBS 121167]KAF2137739.1 hypothetical protein K452DRAFT_339842 [Aplosporella prunicola CBS 121167]